MSKNIQLGLHRISRRGFLSATGVSTAGLALAGNTLTAADSPATATPKKKPATVRLAFLYPSTQSLKEEGYYSWPGSGFDAEGHQKQYTQKIKIMAKKLGINLILDENHGHYSYRNIDTLINRIGRQKPDGLLLIPFKKSEVASMERIINETKIPTVAMATIGVLLMNHIHAVQQFPNTYLISSLDNFQAIEEGLNMIKTLAWMKQARLLSVAGNETGQYAEKKLGTQIHVVPMQRLAEEYQRTPTDTRVRDLARTYLTDAKQCREPSENDVLEAARTYVACKQLMEKQKADAVMINCLEGIQKKDFPPPCMGYMSLRDEGIVAGCQNDLDATLTMMLVQQLFNRPGFQQNAACDTQKNIYFGAHCTCPSKLHGPDSPAAPYILRNHAEAAVGTVPQVLWPQGQEITMAHYLAGEEPQMLIYSGKVIECYDTPPAGGCRTNVAIQINEVKACQVKGMHQTIFAGNYTKQLRSFCHLTGIPVSA